jgi:hypothetical protein
MAQREQCVRKVRARCPQQSHFLLFRSASAEPIGLTHRFEQACSNGWVPRDKGKAFDYAIRHHDHAVKTMEPELVYCYWHQSYEPWYAHTRPAPIPSFPHLDWEHYPQVGEHWNGIHISENCRYCYQPLVATPNPHMNYCPHCGRHQWHRL